MKPIHQTKTALINDLALIIFTCGIIFIALKFTVFFDSWVYFPAWPNIGDSAVLIAAACYFVIRIKRR